MFGLDAISSFAHEVEAAFEHVRSGRLAVTKPLIDLSLTATDLVRTMLAAPNEPVPPERERIVAGFRALAPGAAAAPVKAEAAPRKATAASPKAEGAAPNAARLRAALAAADTAALTARSLVAATTSQAPSISRGANSRT